MVMSMFQERPQVVLLKEGSHPYNHSLGLFSINSIDDSMDFIVLRRKKNLPGRPSLYLIAKCKPTDIYISSLFPVEGEENTFKIDFKGIYYKITFTNDFAHILKLSEKKEK